MNGPTNHGRAAWARNALEGFRRETKCDYEDSLGDLLCDLMHFGDFHNFDFEAALARARMNYEAEKAEAEPGNFMHIRCDKCGRADEFDIAITTWARLTSDGTDPGQAHNRDHEWDHNSMVHCAACGHAETLARITKRQLREGTRQ